MNQETKQQISSIQDKTQIPFKQDDIKKTRHITKSLTQIQIFQKAQTHILDALGLQYPRPHLGSFKPNCLLRIVQFLKLNWVYYYFMHFLSYTFMYLVILDKDDYQLKIALESICLIFFFMDGLCEITMWQYDSTGVKRQYESNTLKFKMVILLLLVIDLICFITNFNHDGRLILPFRLLRFLIPLINDAYTYTVFESIKDSWKEMVIFIVSFLFVVFFTSMIGNRSLTINSDYVDPFNPVFFDSYKNDYQNLGHMVFIVYTVSTFNPYPDNQLRAIQNFQPNFIFFIVFQLLTLFIFSSIPGEILYMNFRQHMALRFFYFDIFQQNSLILAFTTLAGDNKKLQIQRLTQFFLYFYKYKVRYVQQITQLILSLDKTNKKYIQASEFMQLGKLIAHNSQLSPPRFKDIQCWIRFRYFLNSRLNLKYIVKNWIFELLASIIIIGTFINSIFLMYDRHYVNVIIDEVVVWVFVVELAVRIIAIGPEVFFSHTWNSFDTFLVIVSALFFFVPLQQGTSSLIHISRIFRVSSLFRLIARSNYLKDISFQTTNKLVQLCSSTLIIIPTILHFIPLLLILFFIFSIISMQFFYGFYDIPGSSAYDAYVQFSNFKTFRNSQYVMIQILTQGGWSYIPFDLAYRRPDYYYPIMLWFVLMHIFIVYLATTLIKGIFWEVYLTVSRLYLDREKQQNNQMQKISQKALKKQQYIKVNEQIQSSSNIEPNTIIKRKLYQNKINIDIMKNIKTAIFQSFSTTSKQLSSSKRCIMVQNIINHWSLDSGQIKLNKGESLREARKSRKHIQKRQNTLVNFSNFQIQEFDYDMQMENLLNDIVINSKIKYSSIIAYPKPFIEFLQNKLQAILPKRQSQQQFNITSDIIKSQASVNYHLYELQSMLGIKVSKRQQKKMILTQLANAEVISMETVEIFSKKKLLESNYNVSSSSAIRDMFLSDTKENLINKFEIQYLSDLYGVSFKQINKTSIKPLLKIESNLVYCLRNLLRYPQVPSHQFFEILTNIEDRISNKLLKKGSLFKFLYKIDNQSDIWFSIEFNTSSNQPKIHFIKTGLWIYHKNMQEQQFYYGKDFFNWDMRNKEDHLKCQGYIKRLYESFEGLAFSLLKDDPFFQNNAQNFTYDLYTYFFNVGSMKRYVNKQIQISKIMLVILSKEDERKDLGLNNLPYKLSDIKASTDKQKDIGFRFIESYKETMQKLMEIDEDQDIIQTQGLPFAYMVNFMRGIQQIMDTYALNFVFHIENVFNQEFDKAQVEIKKQKKEKEKEGQISFMDI